MQFEGPLIIANKLIIQEMAKIGNLSIVVFLLSGVASIMTKPILDGFDDEGGGRY